MADTQTNPTQPNKLASRRAAQWTRQGLLNASLVALMTGVVLGKQLLLKPTLLQMGSPAGGYGWVPLPNPNPVPLPFGTGPTNYDWTGLDVASHLKWRDRDALDSTGKSYGGFYGYNYLDSSSSGGLIEYTSDVTGTSTFKWKWCPPLDPATGQPDLTNFPAPPLYAVGRVSAYVSGNLTSPPRANGVSGHGSISYGLAAGDGGSFDGVPGHAPGDSQDELQRAVLGPAVRDGADADGFPVYRIGVSPSLHVSLTASVPGDPLNGGGRIGVNTPDIKLAAPDPMKRPDALGDGGNQFVFNDPNHGTPLYEKRGWLEVPVAAEVTGGTGDDANHLIHDPKTGNPHIDWKVDPKIPNHDDVNNSPLTPYSLTATGSAISVQTAGTDPKDSKPWPAGKFIFLGLPDSFSTVADGNHTVTLKVDGQDSTPAHIQIFYPGLAFNHPGFNKDANGQDYRTPNWYYYYGQTPVKAGGYYEPDAGLMNYSRTEPTPPYAIHIHDDAYFDKRHNKATYQMSVFDLDVADPNTGLRYYRRVGSITTTGIHSYVWVCAHEGGHRALDLRGNVYNWFPYMDSTGQPKQRQPAGTWSYNPPDTKDGDDVIDSWEPAHHLKNTVADTTGTYVDVGNTGDAGDDEVLADIQALPALFININLWQNDWASPGIQWGGGKPLYFNPKPKPNQEGFYWIFNAEVDATVEHGTFKAGGTYHIHSLQDLQAQYSDIQSSIQ